MSSTRPRRPALLEIGVAAVIVAMLAGVVALQLRLGGSSGGGPDAPERTGSGEVTSAGEPSGSASPGAEVTTAMPTAPVVTGLPTTPTSPTAPAEALPSGASDLASLAEGIAVPTAFRIATFNVLGASHTRPGGKAASRPSGAERMRGVVQLLAAYAVDVVGFQEFEPEQSEAFDALAGSAWDSFPGTSGGGDVRRTIAWRTDTWELVAKQTMALPYFNGGIVHSPWVRLRNVASGREVWFGNVHNPADTPQFTGQEQYRDEALRREIEWVNTLHADGTPVVLMGDMNEREEFWCTIAARAPVVSADGSGYSELGCSPAANLGIDWIVGTTGFTFSGFTRDRSELAQWASDHPMVTALAQLP